MSGKRKRLDIEKVYHLGGLDFEYRATANHFFINGIWKGKKLEIASGEIGPNETHNEFLIDNFFADDHGFQTPYYEEASKVAKENNRTMAGIVMEIMKTEMEDGYYLRVEADAWGRSSLNSRILKEAARQLLRGGEAADKKAEVYLRHRYERLFPGQEVEWDTFLANTERNGWYGAWIPQESTLKKDIITTAARVFVDRALR